MRAAVFLHNWKLLWWPIYPFHRSLPNRRPSLISPSGLNCDDGRASFREDTVSGFPAIEDTPAVVMPGVAGRGLKTCRRRVLNLGSN